MSLRYSYLRRGQLSNLLVQICDTPRCGFAPHLALPQAGYGHPSIVSPAVDLEWRYGLCRVSPLTRSTLYTPNCRR
jgi:hypothetical protein